jgi:hypothetical protein
LLRCTKAISGDGLVGATATAQGLQNSTLYAGAMAVKAADPGQVISKGVAAVSKFAENSEVILKGLDAVKTIHPFIGSKSILLTFQLYH